MGNSEAAIGAVLFGGMALLMLVVTLPLIFNNDAEKIAACMIQDGMDYYRGNCITEEMAKQ